jgi:Toprim domain/CHC2 zinc finger
MSIPADFIDRARRADVLEAAQSLGAGLRRVSATESIGPCLVCGGNDRFSTNSRKQLWNCRGCNKGGSTIDLVQHVRGCGFREAVAFLAGGDATQAPQARPRITPRAAGPEDKESDAIVTRLVAEIVREMVPVRSTPAEEYLRETRKIDTFAIADMIERTDAIGWHPSVLFRDKDHPLDSRRLGCIVSVMTDPVTAMPTGAISRTYLTPGLAKVGKGKTLGKPAGIVRLSADEDVLEGVHLAEGLESAIAAMSIGLRPMWSTGSTAIMAKFPTLLGIAALTIIADHDPNGAGEEAARTTEARWRAAGREVRLLRLDRFGDFNDALVGDAT